MYLGRTDGLRATPKGQCSADHKSETTHAETAAAPEGVEPGCRIGVVISDECSSSDVAKVLADTCERFGAQQGGENRAGKISITILADHSGFVLRENACLPVWCEAIYDVDPLDFHYFVVPESAPGAPGPRPEIVSWLARAGASAKIIRLPFGARTLPDGLERPADAAVESKASYRGDLVEVDRQKAWRDEMTGATQAPAAQVPFAAPSATSFDMPAPSERIRATVEWLSENYGGRISISSMAERALMSERNFLRRFRAEMGHTPHEYLSKIRLESARKLLLSTALPVDKIARHCGLFNGDHLRKHFVKHFGMSPVEYRTARFKALQSQAGSDKDES